MSDQQWFDYVYDFASLTSEIVILRRGGWTRLKRREDMPWQVYMELSRHDSGASDARRIVALLNAGPS